MEFNWLIILVVVGALFRYGSVLYPLITQGQPYSRAAEADFEFKSFVVIFALVFFVGGGWLLLQVSRTIPPDSELAQHHTVEAAPMRAQPNAGKSTAKQVHPRSNSNGSRHHNK